MNIPEDKMSIKIRQIDHIVLTVKDIDATCQFYKDILGMEVIHFGEGRKALHFGNQKLNLHELGKEPKPNATNATSGTIDICLLSDTPLKGILRFLEENNIPIEEGPIIRTGATTPINSIYIRDPDNNLIEISNNLHPEQT